MGLGRTVTDASRFWNIATITKLDAILRRQPALRNADIAVEMGVTLPALQTAMTRFNLSPHTRRENVKRWREQKPGGPISRQVRPCMCCERPFGSEGKHNRLCPSCAAGEGITGEDDNA